MEVREQSGDLSWLEILSKSDQFFSLLLDSLEVLVLGCVSELLEYIFELYYK